MWIPNDVPFVRMSTTRPGELLKRIMSASDEDGEDKPVEIKIISFEKSDECIVIDSLPVTIYRQVGLDSWDH